MAEVVWYPPEVVVVPRAVFKKWSGRGYSEMQLAAAQGIDGLQTREGKALAATDTALFRPAHKSERGFAPDSALLYSRGW